MLAVSRAIGDSDFKDDRDKPAEEQAVSSVPEIKMVYILVFDDIVFLNSIYR